MSPASVFLVPLALLAFALAGDAPQDPNPKRKTQKEDGVIIWEAGKPRQNGQDVFVVTLVDPRTSTGERDVRIPVGGIGRSMSPARKAQHLKEAIEREVGRHLDPHRAGHVLIVKAKHPNKGVKKIALVSNGSRQKGMRRRISTPITGPLMADIPSQTIGNAKPLVIEQVGRFSLTGSVPSGSGYVVQIGIDKTLIEVDPSAYLNVPHLLFDLTRQLKQRGRHAELVRATHGLEIVVLLTDDDEEFCTGCDAPTLLSSDSIELWED